MYIKELLKELEALKNKGRENEIFTTLDKLLIYLNFNSEAYINYITQKIANKINDIESIHEKIDYLQFQFKEFNQLHRKAGIALCPQQTDLKDALGNWFTQEIFYLEKNFNCLSFHCRVKRKLQSKKHLLGKRKPKCYVYYQLTKWPLYSGPSMS